MAKIYISGKITGLHKIFYTAKFNEAHNECHMAGYEVLNPLLLSHNHDKSWKSYMREDLLALKLCDSIYMISNWEESRGAKIEHWFAKRYGKKIIYQP